MPKVIKISFALWWSLSFLRKIRKTKYLKCRLLHFLPNMVRLSRSLLFVVYFFRIVNTTKSCIKYGESCLRLNDNNKKKEHKKIPRQCQNHEAQTSPGTKGKKKDWWGANNDKNDKTKATYETIDAQTKKNCKRGSPFCLSRFPVNEDFFHNLFKVKILTSQVGRLSVSFNP